MAQRSLFFNDTESEQRVYFAEDEARYNYLMMAGQGIAKQGDYEAYEIAPKQNMVVTIGAGAAFIKGYLHEVYDTAEELELDAADPTNDRIDRIVLRFVNVTTEREIRLEVLKGTPSANPVPPSVTRTEDVIELSLAQIRVTAGKSFIEPSQITDEKDDQLVCGYSPLHNLLRGVQVTEKGIFSVINSPYLDTRNDTGWISTVGPNKPVKIPFGSEFYNTNTIYDESKSEITIQESGVYIFRIYFGLNTVPNGRKFYLHSYVNGIQDRQLFVHYVDSTGHTIHISNNFKRYEKGDKVTFWLTINDSDMQIDFRNAYLTFAKIQ